MACSKRYHKDLLHIIDEGVEVYWKGGLLNYKYHSEFIHSLCLILNQLPNDIIRDWILPKLSFPIQPDEIKENNVYIKNINRTFVVHMLIRKKKWEIQFTIPADFPFKPPKILLNGVSFLQIKNGSSVDGSPCDSNTLDMLVGIERCFHEQWSAVTRLHSCIEFIKTGINIHYQLPYKSRFISATENP